MTAFLARWRTQWLIGLAGLVLAGCAATGGARDPAVRKALAPDAAAGVSLSHIPYWGGSSAITDVIGGQVNLVAVNALEVLPHVKSGRLKVLAVMSPTRAANLPDVPTIAESGFPGFDASVWYGFMAPAGTPRPIVERLHVEVQKALASPEVRERMASSGGEAVPASIADFAALIRSERQRYEKLVREANIKPD